MWLFKISNKSPKTTKFEGKKLPVSAKIKCDMWLTNYSKLYSIPNFFLYQQCEFTLWWEERRGRGIFCAYLSQTLQHHITLNGIVSHSFPLAVQKALLKYSKRLFHIDINSIIATEIPHKCHHSGVCLHTSQHSLDNGTLIIGYNSTWNICHFVNNCMDHVFAGL
jgi:hypothetical protein